MSYEPIFGPIDISSPKFFWLKIQKDVLRAFLGFFNEVSGSFYENLRMFGEFLEVIQGNVIFCCLNIVLFLRVCFIKVTMCS